jgi:hypothetical protein
MLKNANTAYWFVDYMRLKTTRQRAMGSVDVFNEYAKLMERGRHYMVVMFLYG